jgi:CBS domain containing-hemolysin-like protein
VLLVAETQKIGDLLRQMQTRREHLAVVVDEFGGTAGIATLEDVIEEIVGDIHDEHDDGDPDVEQIAPDRYLVDATLSIYDLEKALDVVLPEDDGGYESVGGLLLERTGHVPVQNERVVVGDLELIVRDADRRRVRRVEVVRRRPHGEGEAAAE